MRYLTVALLCISLMPMKDKLLSCMHEFDIYITIWKGLFKLFSLFLKNWITYFVVIEL